MTPTQTNGSLVLHTQWPAECSNNYFTRFSFIWLLVFVENSDNIFIEKKLIHFLFFIVINKYFFLNTTLSFLDTSNQF